MAASAASIAMSVSVIRIGRMAIQLIGLRRRIATVSAATISVATVVTARHIGPRLTAKRTAVRARLARMKGEATSAPTAVVPAASSMAVAGGQVARDARRASSRRP